jgi:DNA repair photolyase
MHQLHEAGVATYAFIGPILPQITALEPIFRAIAGAADTVWGEALNIRCGNWEAIMNGVAQFDPSLQHTFEAAVRDKQYWARIAEEFRSLSETFKIPLVGFYRH